MVEDPERKPVQYANVLLLNSKDSSLVKGMITDSLGKYSFENISAGEYIIKATLTGMDQGFTPAFEIRSDHVQSDQGILSLKANLGKLKDVTVTLKKPMFEQKIDRTIINVKSSITNAGGSALEVLEKSPGVTVSRQSNSIALNGKNGVAIMINGKISYMPADALIQFLAGISANNIDKIELITTPPSKYDAGGNGGYINIVLINNPYAGFSGSYFLTAGYGQGFLGAAGINFNFRSAGINVYGSYSYNYAHTLQPSTAFTGFTKGGERIENASFSDRDAVTQVQNLRMGMDYELNSSSTIGILVGGYNSRWSMLAHNGSTVSYNGTPDTVITMVDDPELNIWKNASVNLNFQHVFKPGKMLFFDVNYIYYRDNNPNNYSTDYYSNLKELLFHQDLTSGKVTPIHFRVVSADYSTPLGKKMTMETGAKLSLSDFNNDVQVNYLNQGIWIPDTSLSSNYTLKENIGAAYASFSFNPNSKITLTAGLRYEYTFSDLGTTKKAHIVNRKYGELFPTFYISKKIDEQNNINLSYSRRITRPTFNDLAPFTIFFDPKTFFAGNPALQPAIANTIQAGYGYKNYSFTISYTHEENSIDNFYFQTRVIDTVNNILYLSARNFDYALYLNASFSLPVVVNKWWSMQNNITGDWRQINTEYEKIKIQLENYSYSIHTTQRFLLPGDFSVEITGMYSSAALLGTLKCKPLYQLDGGLQKKFGNKNDIIRFTVNDIFNSGSNFRFVENMPIPSATISRNFNFGLVAYKLTYTHRFGNKALKEKRERTTGAEDELMRVRN